MDDIRRIGFVARRYLELQGLVPAAFGAGVIFSALLHQYAGAAARYGSTSQVFMLAALIGGTAIVPLQRMYRRTYGDLVATRQQKAAAALPMMLFYIASLFDFSWQIDRPHGGPSIVAITVAAQAAWVVLRDWRWRMHHLAGVAAGVSGAIVTASMPLAPNQFGVDPPRAEAFILAYALIGLGLMISGLFDHRVLARTLTPIGDDEVPAIAAGHASSVLALSISVVLAGVAGVCLRFSDGAIGEVLPLGLFVPLGVGGMVTWAQQATRGIQDFRHGRRPVDSGLRIDIQDDLVAVLLLIAVVATLDVALLSSPAILAVTIGGAAAWLAARRPGQRRAYLAWTLAAAAVALMTPHLAPARAFAWFLLMMGGAGGAVALMNLLGKATFHADTV